MTLLYISLGFLAIVLLMMNQGTVYDFSKKKQLEGVKYQLLALIPVYGYLKIKSIVTEADIDQRELKHLLSFDVLSKRFLLSSLFLLIGLLILVPVSVFLYLSANNNLARTLLSSFMVLVIFFMHQGLVVDLASKRGYEGIKPGLMGLIPMYGFIYYLRQPKRRNVSNKAILEIFKPTQLFGRFLVYAQITFVAVIVIVPVIYIFGMAFSNIRTDIPNQLWPDNPNLEAFRYLFNETNFTKWYWNTLSIALINMFVGTFLITGAAYVFARFSFKGKKAGLLAILVLQAFPSFMGLIAMYVLFWKFNLLGQPRALSILYIGGSIPGNLWLIKGFLSQIPKDLDESAMIDGANKFQIFTKIILPLSVPILTFVAVSMFMGPWMDYMLPGYLLRFEPKNPPDGYDITNQWTLAVGLFRFVNDLNYRHFSAFAAGAILVGLPITALYMAFQKYLIEGIMAGATKG